MKSSRSPVWVWLEKIWSGSLQSAQALKLLCEELEWVQVMGSKNLKAVAMRGTLDITISDPKYYFNYYLKNMKKLMETKWVQALGKYGTPLLFQYANAMGFLSIRNNQFTTIGDQGYALEAEALEPFSTGMLSCFGCPAHCRHRFSIEEGESKGTKGEGPEYASIGSLGTKLGNIDLENIIHATKLCNRYGLDTISTGSYLAWVMELFQRGIIDQEMTEIPLSWGDGKQSFSSSIRLPRGKVLEIFWLKALLPKRFLEKLQRLSS